MANEVHNRPKPVRRGSLPEWAKAGGAGRAGGESAAPIYRVSRQLAGMLAGGALLLALAAFGLGWKISQKITTRQLEEAHQAEVARITESIMTTQGGAAPGDAGAADPRQKGLNYVRLCQVPEGEGEKYARFLATYGQATWRVPVVRKEIKPGMLPMVTLYAVNRGFQPMERVEMEKARAALLGLGDQWAKKNRGGNPFRSLMLEKYGP